MNDFDYDIKEKKALVPSAHKRVGRTRKCTLPSDYLTEGEKKRMNGEVVTISMNAPVKYRDLIKASEDVQKQYIKHLQDTYNASVRMLEQCLGVSYVTVREYLVRLGLNRDKSKGRATFEQKAAWEQFCNPGEKLVIDTEVTKAMIEHAPIVSVPVEETGVEFAGDDDYVLCGMNVELEGSAYAVCKKLVSMIGADAHGVFTINVRLMRDE